MSEILIALAPLFVLLAALLLGRYPGCEAIVRLGERFGVDARPRGAQAQARPAAPVFRAPSGGLLLALGFATRPPPSLLA
jgi:hypothetical protein